MSEATQEKTGLGNYFVANYPPFSAWKPAHLPAAHAVLASAPKPDTPLGLYLHIPFCRKRCKFCYFRVYTDKNARDVEDYLDALIKEVSLCARQPIIGGRPLKYIYFGGGTPSYLSASQLRSLMSRLKEVLPWDGAEEVTFECEPGTLQEHKLEALRDMGVTRLSLGIENFDYHILEYNGRAHRVEEIYRAYEWARNLGFNQINIDLISGMVGETWDNWKDCVKKTLELAPESVTIYQMELPYNTVFSNELKVIGQDEPRPFDVADWPTKRAWTSYAFDEMIRAGYQQSSAYTLVKNRQVKFVYRDSLWHGADMFGTGVASFGHLGGVHVQNVDTWEDYIACLDRDELPLHRAMPVSPRQLLIREMILQLKTGHLEVSYFREKFRTNIIGEWEDGWQSLAERGFLRYDDSHVELTREGYLQVDRLLPTFFEPEYQNTRYT
jgi:oxygen-independent coproporphyrinogen III oxidase